MGKYNKTAKKIKRRTKDKKNLYREIYALYVIKHVYYLAYSKFIGMSRICIIFACSGYRYI